MCCDSLDHPSHAHKNTLHTSSLTPQRTSHTPQRTSHTPPPMSTYRYCHVGVGIWEMCVLMVLNGYPLCTHTHTHIFCLYQFIVRLSHITILSGTYVPTHLLCVCDVPIWTFVLPARAGFLLVIFSSAGMDMMTIIVIAGGSVVGIGALAFAVFCFVKRQPRKHGHGKRLIDSGHDVRILCLCICVCGMCRVWYVSCVVCVHIRVM